MWIRWFRLEEGVVKRKNLEREMKKSEVEDNKKLRNAILDQTTDVSSPMCLSQWHIRC